MISYVCDSSIKLLDFQPCHDAGFEILKNIICPLQPYVRDLPFLVGSSSVLFNRMFGHTQSSLFKTCRRGILSYNHVLINLSLFKCISSDVVRLMTSGQILVWSHISTWLGCLFSARTVSTTNMRGKINPHVVYYSRCVLCVVYYKICLGIFIIRYSCHLS